MSFPRYPSYRDSNVSWLGDVPSHWEVIQSRRLFSQRKERARAGDRQLTASQKHGIIFQEDFMQLEGQNVVQVVQDPDILKHVEPNDFVISMRSFQGGLEWSGERGCISSAYVMLTPSDRIDPSFFRYLFKSTTYIQALQSTTNLVRDGQAMRFENFAQVPLPLVPRHEQAAIAAFLDHETAKIAALVDKQQRLIELLKEEIISLVLSAYDGGSSTEVRLGSAVDVIGRPVIQEPGETYRPLGLYNRGRGLFHKEPRRAEEMGDSDFFWIEPGDLIISGQFAWEGAVALAGVDEAGCVVSHRYPVLRGRNGVALTEYVFGLLLTNHGQFLLNEHSRGAAGRNRPLNLKTLLKEKVLLPDLDRQQLIGDRIHSLGAIRAEVAAQTALLQERRAALISAAVTGKIEVQGAAAQRLVVEAA